MTLYQFIAANPAVAVFIIGALFTVIGTLISALIFFVKRSFDNLTTAIGALQSSLKEDKSDIGVLKDRMTEQETVCRMQRTHCPVDRPQSQIMVHQ